MRTLLLAALALPLALTGCSGETGNVSGNAANVVAEEGLQDLNSAIGGDELSPIPEAEDDMAANRSAAAAGNAAAPR